MWKPGDAFLNGYDGDYRGVALVPVEDLTKTKARLDGKEAPSISVAAGLELLGDGWGAEEGKEDEEAPFRQYAVS